ncbi:VOC family protein [Microbacterium gorillae]|uniref:VOC family protein n=1 Tax=Microbacterium gorillae TaxID=1231063 RepID=UPI00058CD030|nr:VOC family protein [Microbacterium gorillae]
MAERDSPLIHHTVLYASDYEASERIFSAALTVLDIVPGFRTDTGVEYWRRDVDTPSFCVERATSPDKATRRVHLAFTAPDRAAVDAFHAAAVAAGAESRHAPRLWPEYRAYCAFFRDPDGNNIEAVCKEPGTT